MYYTIKIEGSHRSGRYRVLGWWDGEKFSPEYTEFVGSVETATERLQEVQRDHPNATASVYKAVLHIADLG